MRTSGGRVGVVHERHTRLCSGALVVHEITVQVVHESSA